MRSLLGFVVAGLVALAGDGYAQEAQKKPDKAESTKALYMVQGLH
jgi:hypothetical protein